MRRFGFFWHDSHDDTFHVEVENPDDVNTAFKKQWSAWIEELRGYPHNKDHQFSTAEEKLAEEHSIREVGDPAIKWNPRPTCCDQINELREHNDHKGPPVQLRTHRINPDSNDWHGVLDPHWVIREVGFKVKWCPFCGMKLPEVERLDPPPQPLHVDDDDGYCVTCGERCMCCECNPPWAAYRLK